MLALGAAVAVVGLWSAGRRVERTRYRPDRWRLAELVVVAARACWSPCVMRVVRTELFVAHPGVEVAPTLSVLALVGVWSGWCPPSRRRRRRARCRSVRAARALAPAARAARRWPR